MNSIRITLVIFLLVSSKLSQAQCTTSFSYTLNNNGAVTFYGSAAPVSSLSSYYWQFGNSTSTAAINQTASVVSNTYTANGIYTVSLMYVNGSCTVSTSQTIQVSNANACGLSVYFYSSSQNYNGVVNFQNASAATNPAANITYNWVFGDNSPNSNAINPIHTYSANGTYLAKLYASSASPFCMDSVFLPVVVNTFCNINAGFTYSVGSNGSVSFLNTTTPTTTPLFYLWDFGNSATSPQQSPTHVYTTPGTYTVTLFASSSTPTWVVPYCTGSVSAVITVSNTNPCSLIAGFTHTLSGSGLVNFSNASTGTTSGTSYAWNFGDGWTSTSLNPSHTYINAGTYTASLLATNNSVNCIDTIRQIVNVTGITCLANSGFSMQSTSTPQFWYVLPYYPWNVSNAVWSWGDNTTSNGIYSSHQYSVAGNYNICLSVTVSCGATSSSCATYSVFRSAGNIINVQVVAPAPSLEITGISDQSVDLQEIKVVPNPNNGLFSIQMNNLATSTTRIMLYNMVGQKVYEANYQAENNAINKSLDLSNQSAGVYFIKMTNGNSTLTKKLVISH